MSAEPSGQSISETPDNEQAIQQTAPWPWAVGIGLLVLVIWALSGYFAGGAKGAPTLSDVWAPSESLFGGLAFAGVIYAILLQRNELELQREELRRTRVEMKAQRAVFQEQNFESTFFQLMRLQNDIVNAIDLSRNREVVTHGRDCFKTFHDILRGYYIEASKTHRGDQTDLVAAVYEQTYVRYESDLGHYFRNLFQIVKFVDSSAVPDKRLYTNFVRAQLSSYELGMLFYNCVTPYGRDKFRPLIQKYGMLKNMSDRVLLSADHREFYAATAFQGRS